MTISSLNSQGTLTALRRAHELDEAGEYRAAVAELAGLWEGPGTEPQLENLSPFEAADLLLRAGSLSNRLGGTDQLSGAQDSARNLLTRAEERFARLGDLDKLAETQTALAICYWRSGSFGEARIILREGLTQAQDLSADAKLRLQVTLGVIEMEDGDTPAALGIYRDCAGLCEQVASSYLVGTYHMNYSRALRASGSNDDALIEAAAADYYLEQAGHVRYRARVLNNIAWLLLTLNRISEAHESLDRSEHLFQNLRDRGMLAQVADTRAHLYLAEHENEKAEESATAAIKILAGGEERAGLVEALVTHATALARLKRLGESVRRFGEAWETAQQFIGEQRAAEVAVALVEEIVGPAYVTTGAGFEGAISRVEARLIVEALEQSDGGVTGAASRLKLKHQTLGWMLKSRHQNLQGSRRPLRPRKKSLMTTDPGKLIRMKRRVES
jgi:tetratricopeptide (TPR) repeat protein